MTPEENEAFQKYYDRSLHKVIVYAYSMLHDWHDAEAAAQETFYVALKKWAKVSDKTEEDRMNWMKLVAKNQCKNILRTRVRQTKLRSLLETLAQEAAPPDDPLAIIEILDKCEKLLTKKEMAAFKAVAIDRLTYSEAADHLGIREGTCRKRYNRALEKLRTHWYDT